MPYTTYVESKEQTIFGSQFSLSNMYVSRIKMQGIRLGGKGPYHHLSLFTFDLSVVRPTYLAGEEKKHLKVQRNRKI